MKKKILLCSLKFSAKAHSVGPRTENLGLCYLLGYLKYHGFDGEIYDGNAYDISFNDNLARCDLSQYVLIGFSVYSTNYLETLKAIKFLRDAGYNGHITMGGHYPSFNREAILERHPEIDSVVVGEGEEPLLAMAESLESGSSIAHITGLAFHSGGAVRYNPPVHLIESLDFPFFPDRTYYEELLKRLNFSTLTSSRGCWGSCSFCSVRNFYRLCKGEGWRYRSPSHVVDELEDLNKRLGITNFAFFDDNFIGPGKKGKARAQEIAREIIRRELDIVFSLECRPDDVEEELINLLSKAGLVKVSLGIESLVHRQQELYNKVIEFEKIERAVRLLEKLDILCSLYLILFDPFVTFDELLMNFDMIGRLGTRHFRSFTGFLQVFSGIPLQEKFKEENLLEASLIAHTGINEFWIHYRFKDERIGLVLAVWLEFEEKMGFRFARAAPKMADERGYELYKEQRELIFECFYKSIEEGKKIGSVEELAPVLKSLTGEYLSRGEIILNKYLA